MTMKWRSRPKIALILHTLRMQYPTGINMSEDHRKKDPSSIKCQMEQMHSNLKTTHDA